MTTEAMKAWFRDYFREWVERVLKEPFDSLQDIPRSKLMARFFAEQVLRPRNPSLLPFAEEDIHRCVVDGKDDCSVDFISREGGTVLIIQAKYSRGKKAGKRPHEDAADFEYFRTVLGRLKDYRECQMTEPLREVAADIDWETDRFQLYYITLRSLAANQDHAASHGPEPMPDIADLLDRSELYLLDEVKLNQELRDTLSLDEVEGKCFQLQFTKNEDAPPWVRLCDSETRPCYVGCTSGSQLAALFAQHRSSLFTLNIRNYIGDNVTNKTIRKTALASPEDFFFFNNGISALATRVTPDPHDERSLICERLSVVNGAQTIRSLHKAHVENPIALRDVHVLLRVTEFKSKKSEAEQEFLDNVTKYNNTQNAIKLSDFRSNDKVQFDLRKKFDSLPSVNARKFLYKNKRSGERERDRIVIGMEEFAKSLYAFMFGPDDVYGGTGHVFDSTQGGGYGKLFGEAGEILPSLPHEMFEKYAGTWFICDTAKGIWRSESHKTQEPGLERRWMFYFALGESLRLAHSSQGLELDPCLRRLANPVWLQQPADGPVKKVIARHCRVAFKALIDTYKASAEKQGFKHRNWFRSSTTLSTVSEYVNSSWGLLSEHADDYLLSRPKNG